MNTLLRAAVAATALMVATPAMADIVIRDASDNQGILVHGTGDQQIGTTVTGALGANGPEIVNFDADTSGPTDDIRLQGGEGQADVTGAEIVLGGNPNDAYSMLSGNIYLNNGEGMSWIEFALTSGAAGTIDFILTDMNGGTFNFFDQIIGNGDTFFAFEAIDGQLIANVYWQADTPPGSVDILKQVRILRDGDAPVVPEPATWAMMLMGFGATGFAMRRGRRRNQDGELAQLA
jgi:hypothetical protein